MQLLAVLDFGVMWQKRTQVCLRIAASKLPLNWLPLLAFLHLGAQAEQAPISPEQIFQWQKFDFQQVSADGKWFACRSKGDTGKITILVRATATDEKFQFEAGEVPHPAVSAVPGRLVFSSDGKWLACLCLPQAERGMTATEKSPRATRLKLLNLTTGEVVEYTRVKSFTFSGKSSRYIIVHRDPAVSDSNAKGSDLVLRELATGHEFTIAHVSEYTCNKPGLRVAWVDTGADDKNGGVSIFDCNTGNIRILDSACARYVKPTWNEGGDAFSVLRCAVTKSEEMPTVAVVFVRDFATDVAVSVYDSTCDPTFPSGFVISEHRAPRWTEDREAILFGITPKRPEIEKPSDKKNGVLTKPNLILWHWQDPRLQSVQIKNEETDRHFNFLSIYHPSDRRVVRLATEKIRDIRISRRGNWAVGIDTSAYDFGSSLNGRAAADLYRINLATGAAECFARKVDRYYGISPDGARFLYFAEGHFHACELAADRDTNLTAIAPISFVDTEDDNPIPDIPVAPVGWASDGQSVLLSDGWDVWWIPISGRGAVNLTNEGRRDRIRYEHLKLDEEDVGIDLSEPIFCRTTSDLTKQGGLVRLDPGSPTPKVLTRDDASYLTVLKGRNAASLVYTREDFGIFPDFWAADADFAKSRRLTDGQAQLAQYAWSSGVRLINYESAGPTPKKNLRAALFLPARYRAGERYPTIVVPYERQSDNLHRFNPPGSGDFSRSYYTSHGYAVLYPDISYQLDNPGLSALWCIPPAVQAAVQSGITDANRVGLFGHSWGGYETVFLITQNSTFKAAVAGAALTDLVSMYGLIYKRGGQGNGEIFESSQPRFTGWPLNIPEAYQRNSPIAHATKIHTPLLLVHNDQDDAVDFTQGLELYSMLRRLGKPVVLLEYPGESHHLLQPENRLDYLRRQKEFFDCYLKGAAAPQWWSGGIKRIELNDELEHRIRSSLRSAP